MLPHDEIRQTIANDPDVIAATQEIEAASAGLIEAVTGTGPLRIDRPGKDERAILIASQRYRTAENTRNRAIANAMKDILS